MPPQKLQVLASTQAPETLLVLPAGCSIAAGDASNCTDVRGGVYNNTKSSGWVSKNIYALQIEGNLGLTTNSDNGQFGYDRFSIPTGQGGNVTLDQQILAGIATKDYFLGSLGGPGWRRSGALFRVWKPDTSRSSQAMRGFWRALTWRPRSALPFTALGHLDEALISNYANSQDRNIRFRVPPHPSKSPHRTSSQAPHVPMLERLAW